MSHTTPGPWAAIAWSCHARTTVVADGNRIVVAECAGHGRHTDESLGDALLIAAAPDMLEALERVKLELELQDYVGDALDKVEKAIRKAKGQV